jgi:hypothetical protein
MRKRLLISGLVFGLVALATVRWTIEGLGWAIRVPRLRPAT